MADSTPASQSPVSLMRNFPRSDDFAVLLGIIESAQGTRPPRSEQHRLDVFNLLYIPRLHQEHPLQQEVIFSRLAALYLPRIVQKFLDPPAPSTSPQWANSVNIDDMPLANAYGYALVHLNGNPYFYKYFRQPMFGDTRRNLIRVMLERLNERSQHWEARSEWNVKYKPKGGIAIPSMIFDFCQLLTSLLLFESEESIHQLGKENTVKQLLPFLKYWNDRYAAASLAQYSNAKGKGKESNSDTGISSVKEWPAYQLWMTLQNGTDEYELSSIRTARAHHGRMEVCAADSCKRAVATDGGPLLQCSQCGTVRYCSEMHQKVAWRHPKTMHKEVCYKAAF